MEILAHVEIVEHYATAEEFQNHKVMDLLHYVTQFKSSNICDMCKRVKTYCTMKYQNELVCPFNDNLNIAHNL